MKHFLQQSVWQLSEGVNGIEALPLGAPDGDNERVLESYTRRHDLLVFVFANGGSLIGSLLSSQMWIPSEVGFGTVSSTEGVSSSG